jgi:hypothetical protein
MVKPVLRKPCSLTSESMIFHLQHDQGLTGRQARIDREQAKGE